MSRWRAIAQPIPLATAICSLALPGTAVGNVVWPPAVYFYMLGVWWVVLAGLLAELVVHLLVLRMPFLSIVWITLVSNAASAAVGIVLTWPAVFWDAGVSKLAAMAPASIIIVLSVIFLINVFIEYIISVRWLKAMRSKAAVASFVLANAVSYGLIVWAAVSDVMIPAQTSVSRPATGGS